MRLAAPRELDRAPLIIPPGRPCWRLGAQLESYIQRVQRTERRLGRDVFLSTSRTGGSQGLLGEFIQAHLPSASHVCVRYCPSTAAAG